MICTNCKREIPNDTPLCPFCGRPVQAGAPPFVPQAPVPRQPAGFSQSQPVQQFPQGPQYSPVQAAPPFAPQAPVPRQPAELSQSQPGQQFPQGPQYSPAQAAPPFAPQAPVPRQPAGFPQNQPVQQFPQGPQAPAYGYGTSNAPQFVAGVQPSRVKTRWVVLGIVAGLLVVAGVILASVLSWYNAPLQKFDRAIEAEDYAAAGDLLELMDYEDRSSAVEELTVLAKDAYWDYNMGDISYEEAKDFLDMLYGCCPESDMKEVLDDFDELYLSRVHYENGATAERIEEYATAIYYYGQVIAEDMLYDDAQEKIEELCEKYREQVLQKARKLAESGAYEKACDILLEGEAFLGSDREIHSLWEEYQEKIWEEDMDSQGFAPSGKYKTVEDFVNSDAMQSQINSMMDSLALNGMRMEVSGEGNKLIYTFIYEDLYGMDEEALGNALAEALDSMGETFGSVASSLKDAVEVEDPIVVVEYVTEDGTVLCSREFKASR